MNTCIGMGSLLNCQNALIEILMELPTLPGIYDLPTYLDRGSTVESKSGKNALYFSISKYLLNGLRANKEVKQN